MGKPSLPTIKRLYAQAGRSCAFQGCVPPVVGQFSANLLQICHIRASSPGGPRYDPDQNEADRQSYDNLLLLCPTHHKIIDSKPKVYSVERLQEMKAQAETDHSASERPEDEFYAASLLSKLGDAIINDNRGNVAINSPGAIQAGTLVLNTTSTRTKILPPADSIGADGDRRRYIKYLIDRYIEFAKNGPGRAEPFKPSLIYVSIKRNFGCQWQMVGLTRFTDLCVYLQERIGKTSLGKIKLAKGYKLYSSFDEYVDKYGR